MSLLIELAHALRRILRQNLVVEIRGNGRLQFLLSRFQFKIGQNFANVFLHASWCAQKRPGDERSQPILLTGRRKGVQRTCDLAAAVYAEVFTDSTRLAS